MNQTGRSGITPVRAIGEILRLWLTGRRGLVVGGIAVVAAGLALGWNWLTAIGAAPIILSLAPCAAMCALGACAMMKGSTSRAKPTAPDQITSPEPTSTQVRLEK